MATEQNRISIPRNIPFFLRTAYRIREHLRKAVNACRDVFGYGRILLAEPGMRHGAMCPVRHRYRHARRLSGP